MLWVNPAVGDIEPLADPTTGKAVKGYGPRAPIKLPSGKVTAAFHAGVDITNRVGTPVRAAGDGFVVHAGWAGTGLTVGRSGKAVLIAHKDGTGTYYGHLDSLDVRVGQQVSAGQRIGGMGATGNVTGPHLHFEKRSSARYTSTVDPLVWAAGVGLTLGADPQPQEDDMALTPEQETQLAAIGETRKLVAWIAQVLGHGEKATPLWHANRKLDLVLAELAKAPAVGGDVDEEAIARAVVDSLDQKLARAVLAELKKALP